MALFSCISRSGQSLLTAAELYFVGSLEAIRPFFKCPLTPEQLGHGG